jgi:Fic family protein
VLQLASDPPVIDESLIRSLHFMMMKYDLSKNPGRWRPNAIWVEDDDGRTVYEAPDREQVDSLMTDLVAAVNAGEGHPTVRAAMAHLNLTMIHPFSDGNGRMARCLQSLALARDGIVSPEFASIEEYLGRNTRQYYAVLAEVGQGRWNPGRSAHPWLRFCLTAHYRQAQTVLRRVRETEALWDGCERLVAAHSLSGRSVAALCDAARGRRLRRSLYVKLVRSGTGEEISDKVATRELQALVAAGLLEALGAKRGRTYRPTAELAGVWRSIREQRPSRPDDDPYVTLIQPSLPGMGAS